jgi:hypothetical protein
VPCALLSAHWCARQHSKRQEHPVAGEQLENERSENMKFTLTTECEGTSVVKVLSGDELVEWLKRMMDTRNELEAEFGSLDYGQIFDQYQNSKHEIDCAVSIVRCA